MDDRTTRAEWDALSAEEQFSAYGVLEDLYNAAYGVLKEIPDCPDHGYCLPHYRDWIQAQQGVEVRNHIPEPIADALEKIMHLQRSIPIDTPLGDVVTILQGMLQECQSIAFKALGMDKVYAELATDEGSS